MSTILIQATIIDSSDKGIGMVSVPNSFFDEGEEHHSEFILLSSNVETECDDICVRDKGGLD